MLYIPYLDPRIKRTRIKKEEKNEYMRITMTLKFVTSNTEIFSEFESFFLIDTVFTVAFKF